MGKAKKGNFKSRRQGIESKNTTKIINPFEVHFNRQKFNILGRKLKNDRGLPGISRSKALQKRKSTLLEEYKNLNKANKFVDRRIGEKSKKMSSEDKIVARFAAERSSKQNKRKAMFNLGEEEILTHKGQSLNEIEKFEDPRSSDEEDEGGNLQGSFVEDAHFGGGMLKKVDDDDKKKSRQDLIQQLIIESKKRKAEKQKEQDKNIELTEKLDSEWKELKSTILTTAKKKKNEDDDDESGIKKPKLDSYDIALREMMFDKKAPATDKLKSDEELKTENKKKMEKIEEEKLKRMKASFDRDIIKHRSADALDDEFVVDDEDNNSDDQEENLVDKLSAREESVEVGSDDQYSDDDEESGSDLEENGEQSDDEEEEENNEKGGEESGSELEENGEQSNNEEEDNDTEQKVGEESGSELEESSDQSYDDEEEDNDEEEESGSELEENGEPRDEDVEEEEGNDIEIQKNEELSSSKNDEVNTQSIKEMPTLAIIKNAPNKSSTADEIKEKDILRNVLKILELTEINQELKEKLNDKNKKEQLTIINELIIAMKIQHPKIHSNSDKFLDLIVTCSDKDLKRRVIEDIEDDSNKILRQINSNKKHPLPKSFEIPDNYEKFQNLLKDRNLKDKVEIIKKMMKKHDIKLGGENKKMLQLLFTYVIKFLFDEIDYTKGNELIIQLAPQIYDLSHSCGDQFTAELFEKYISEKMNVRNRSSVGLMQIIPFIYPTNDFKHGITIPVFLRMADILNQSKIIQLKHIDLGLKICKCYFVHICDSLRYLPEIHNFLHKIIIIFVQCADIKKYPVKKRIAPECLNEKIVKDKSISKRYLQRVLHLYHNFVINMKKNLVSWKIIIADVIQLLTENKTSLTKLFGKNVKTLIEKILKEQQTEQLYTPLTFKQDRPRPLKLYEPALVGTITDTRRTQPMPEKKREMMKLKHKYKREMKGAVREIRRDRSYISNVLIKQKLQSDAERKQKVKEIMGNIASQAGELNKIDRSKKKKHYKLSFF